MRVGGIELLLRNLSPVYWVGEEVEVESEFCRAVLGVEMGMEKRVLMLMGEYFCEPGG